MTKEGSKIMKWGLPFKHLVINTRDDSNALLHLKNHKRCIVQADGFYEWKSGTKTPYFIKSNTIFNIGAIYTEYKGEFYYALITTNVSEKLAFIHNRMPLLLKECDFEIWFSENKFSDLSIVKPTEQGYTFYRVSLYVNNSKNKGEECIKPINTLVDGDDGQVSKKSKQTKITRFFKKMK
jgi:putative SOS response-associated peptidase YedK